MSRSAGAPVGASVLAPLRHRDAANEAGNGDQTDCGDKRVHVDGRSRVIHAFLVGFWCAGAESDEKPWSRLLAGWERSPTETAACCGNPTSPGVSPLAAQPVVTAANRLSVATAATTAMAKCHRRILPAPRNFTVTRTYSETLGQWMDRAVKMIRIRCVLHVFAHPPAGVPDIRVGRSSNREAAGLSPPRPAAVPTTASRARNP